MFQKKIEQFSIPNSETMVFRYKNLTSTNTFLKKNMEQFPPYSVIWSESQSQGHGRFNRSWYCGNGKDIAFSILMPLNLKTPYLWPNYTQVAACSLVEILDTYNIYSQIKWPNDVLVGQKKISGILCETVIRDDTAIAILGIGININSSSDDFLAINQPAISVSAILGTQVDRKELLVRLLSRLVKNIEDLNTNGFSIFRKFILYRLAYKNVKITISDTKRKYVGNIIDIIDDGRLVFQPLGEDKIIFSAGEISFCRK